MCCRALAFSRSTALQTTASQVCDWQLDPPIALPLVQACLFHDYLHDWPERGAAALLSFALQPGTKGTCQLMYNCCTMYTMQSQVFHYLGQPWHG